MKLISKYKCRYCGEVFDTENRPEVLGFVEDTMFKCVLTRDENDYPVRYAMHYAKDYAENPHIGFAEFIGFEIPENIGE